MIGRPKKPEPIQRTPHIARQKQSSFQYSSNRSISERKTREQPIEDAPGFALPKLRLAAFKLAHAVIVFAFFGFIILLSLVFTKPHIKITSGESIRTKETYNQALAEITGGGFMDRSKLTINRADIATKLEEKFPELLDITVTTPLFSPSIKVAAKTSEPAIVLLANGKNYLVDSRGVALITTDQTSYSTQKLIKLEDQTGAPIQVSKPALTSPQMSFISEVKRQSESKQLSIDQMFLVAGGGELDVRYVGQNYIVKYNLYEDARKSFGTYIATKEFLELMEQPAPTTYIDVRVPERAYTK